MHKETIAVSVADGRGSITNTSNGHVRRVHDMQLELGAAVKAELSGIH